MLREPLEALCRRLDGAIAVSVFGTDGHLLETVRSPALFDDPEEADSLNTLWGEYATVLSQVQESAQMLAAGPLEELLLASERMSTVIRPLNEDVFLALTVRPEASTGKARYLCRVTAPRLLGALS